MQKDFVDIVAKILEETGLERGWLEFEVTESTLFKNEEVMINVISEIREMGIKIALDDFGTGYSSLSRLKHLNCDTVKVDRSFIKNMEEHPDNMIIVEAVIKLSHTLGMNIVAEGVETVQQFQFLHNNKCDEIQGFLFSKPIPDRDFEKLLQKGTCSVDIGNHVSEGGEELG